MLPYLVAFVLLTGLIWAVTEWAYHRELHYLRECLGQRSVRLVTYWPGMEEWRLAAERLANERALAAPEIVPEAAEWREPEVMPAAIVAEIEREEPRKVVDIAGALEENLQPKTPDEANKDAANRRLSEALAPGRPRRESARIRRVAR